MGWGNTRRIVLGDTLIANDTHDEIEVVLAHELAHHVHGDVWKMLLFTHPPIGERLRLGERALRTTIDCS